MGDKNVYSGKFLKWIKWPDTCPEGACTSKAYAQKVGCMYGCTHIHICELAGKVSEYHPWFVPKLMGSL